MRKEKGAGRGRGRGKEPGAGEGAGEGHADGVGGGERSPVAHHRAPQNASAPSAMRQRTTRRNMACRVYVKWSPSRVA